MAAGLGFKDFVTGEVLTAADVDGYLMQGVWVFASAAARDAAVTSPQEGNFAYLKDTNVTTYYTGSAWANLDTTGMTNPMTTTGDTIYSSSGSTPARLGIGTAGQVLQVNSGATAPEWATPASGGGLTLLSTNSLSGATSHTVSSISGSYKNLLFLGKMFRTVNNGDNISIRFNTDSGAKYYATRWKSTGTTFTATVIDAGTQLTDVFQTNNDTGVAEGAQFAINLYRYTDTDVVSGVLDGRGADSTGKTNSHAFFSYDNTAAIDSITLFASTNITGTLYVYGVS